jgi:Cu-Zn family superoxide dismutase
MGCLMKILLSVIAAAGLVFMAFYAHAAGQGVKTGQTEKAISILHPTGDSGVGGVVTFTRQKDGMHIAADMQGLSPGQHGFHIHEYGDCSALDAGSAGGHFNPTGKPHGAPADKERHAGDLGNLSADTQGRARYESTDKIISFEGPTSVIGRAVVVHADPDDLTSQPAGNAGSRVACGVIGVMKK